MKSRLIYLLFSFLFFYPHIASLGQTFPNKIDIEEMTDRVAKWQIDNFNIAEKDNPHDYGIGSWTNAVFYIGLEQWAKEVEDESIYHWLYDIGTKTNWKLDTNFEKHPKYQFYHADEMCLGQFFLNLYERDKDPKKLKSAEMRAKLIIANPPNDNMNYKNKQSWTWCDALYMAPPVFAHLYNLTKDTAYLDFMNTHYMATYNHLYDKEEKLFFRDDSYFDKREQNGEKIFWGRGNGWVIAGLANMLNYLADESEYKKLYNNLFKEMAASLIRFQDKDGYWHASLLDKESYPMPETSATALITYGLAYGVNQGLIDREIYLPRVLKAWDSLTSFVNKDGKLGWVQPIGANPKNVTQDMTATYGVGAFLMIATEIHKLINE